MLRIMKTAIFVMAMMASVNFAFGQELSNIGPEQDFVRIRLEGFSPSLGGTAMVVFYNSWPGISTSITKSVLIGQDGKWEKDFLGNLNGGHWSTVYIYVTVGTGPSQCHATYSGPDQGTHVFYKSGFKPGGGNPPDLPW
jgi:hypothetical protein